jgi:hypothetical protein
MVEMRNGMAVYFQIVFPSCDKKYTAAPKWAVSLTIVPIERDRVPFPHPLHVSQIPPSLHPAYRTTTGPASHSTHFNPEDGDSMFLLNVSTLL